MTITPLRRLDVGRRTYAVQIVRHVGDDVWRPEADPVDVKANAADDTPRQVGIDFALDKLPEGTDWQVLVFEPALVGTGSPAARITPADCARQVGRPAHVIRSGRKRIQPRVHGPIGDVVTKVLPTENLLGTRILLSQDRQNRVGTGSAWWVANEPASTAPASVRGITLSPRTGEVTLFTSLGDVTLPARKGVIPA
ncbi:hypothetical protein [Actinoplanes sp. NPDC026670]|uniref:hypothetical protein n=1 Tax=Actinoplanes sp. NPDC026670 TaxID=3154700 RepID=UPI00340E752E